MPDLFMTVLFYIVYMVAVNSGGQVEQSVNTARQGSLQAFESQRVVESSTRTKQTDEYIGGQEVTKR